MIRPYRKNIVAKGEEKVRFDIFSENSQSYVESCYAFASTDVAADPRVALSSIRRTSFRS